VSLQLISYRAQELLALFDVFVGLHALWGNTINDAEDAASLLG